MASDAMYAKQRVKARVREGRPGTSGASASHYSGYGAVEANRTDPLGFEHASEVLAREHAAHMTTYLPRLSRRKLRWHQVYPTRPLRFRLRSQRLKRFIKKGVPHELRAQVWCYASGASRQIAKRPGYYAELVREHEGRETESSKQIDLDLHRTFPDNIHFSGEGAEGKKQSMRRILIALSVHMSSTGYCQGMNYVVGVLLLVTDDEEQTFWLFERLVAKLIPELYTKDFANLTKAQEILTGLAREHLPTVCAKIERANLPLDIITVKWFLNLYVDVLPIETVLRIWDMMFDSGARILFRAGLAILQLHRKEILAAKDVELIESVRSFGMHSFDCEAFISVARSFKVSKKSVQF